MKNEQFEFFDKILRHLDKEHEAIHPTKLIEHVFPKSKSAKKNVNDFTTTVENIFVDHEKTNELTAALQYLQTKGLVKYDKNRQSDSEYDKVNITKEGSIKIQKSGFVKEYNRAEMNHKVERFNKVITPLIALSALILSLYNCSNK